MKTNPKPWLYGLNWQGIRCEARTRRGTLCQRPARLPVGCCKLHGGASTGPRTKNGLARLTEAKIKHGKFTKEKRAEAHAKTIAPTIISMRKSGSTWKQIAQQLNVMSVPTARGGKWYGQTVLNAARRL